MSKIMRGEQEMIGLISGVASADERVRAVYMNGSRTNANAPKDDFRDYDVVFVVTETEPFVADTGWLKKFGNPLIIQEPDWNDVQNGDKTHDFTKRYAWLMLFDDGNRIDLGIELTDETLKCYLDDKLTVPLLDKDGILPEIPPPSDEDYHIKQPVEGVFTACCNEFWWCLNNVAKGIARDELPYAMSMLNEVVRPELHRMIEWYIGAQRGFDLSAGKFGKFYKKWLPPELYARYAATYPRAESGEIWKAIFEMCDLFHELAARVAERFGYKYRRHEEDGMREYLRMVFSHGRG